MKITTTRRISQFFFFLLFVWFCMVMTLGDNWWQLRGWPVNWFLQLDPLTGLTTILTTRTLYAGLLWGLVTVVLTIVLGRFFCGWVCPFGALHHFVGFLANRKRASKEKIARNRYHPLQSVKYGILVFCLIAAMTQQSIQTGLLDPIPLIHRSANLVLLPLAREIVPTISVIPRYYDDAGSIGMVFLIAVLMNLFVPRFYCRFVCPLGALFGIFGRFALWRVGTTKDTKDTEGCVRCHLCSRHCEGACEPSGQIRISECVLCMNCLDDCHHGYVSYRTLPSAAGERLSPDMSRREFVISFVSGAATIPMIRVDGNVGPNWNPKLIRPPGALPEKEFLARCVKCGQCMRICPTNVIHPAGISGGLESLWTPVLNFRIGTSGCQLNCIACGHLCPTAAIRPLSLDERKGIREYAVTGPVKMGTAFVDQGRCLPWAMGKPCIVCQENCPVSPKAILTQEYFKPIVRHGNLLVKKADSLYIEFEGTPMKPEQFSTGDYYCSIPGQKDIRPRQIVKNTAHSLTVSPLLPWDPTSESGDSMEIHIRLQRPAVDPNRCIGCGVCEHECPVRGKRAIRVTAENESRERRHALML